MKKGIIMEIDERSLTMLTPEGEFLRAKKQDLYYEVGQEIYFSPFQEEERKKFWSFAIFNKLTGKSYAAMAMAAVLIIALVSFIPFSNHNQVYAYMSIDVNPSIELGVNDQLEVVELTGYNESGKQVIKTIRNWEEQSLNDVMEQIITVIKDQGYLDKEKDVVIGMVHIGEIIDKSEEKLDQSIKKLENTIEQDEAKIISVEATKKERELAKENGLTAGQFVKEKIEMNKMDQSQSGKKQLPNQQKNNSQKEEDKVERKNNIEVEEPPARNMAPGQEKKVENQNKLKEDKQKIPPGKEKPEIQIKNNNSENHHNNGKEDNGAKNSNNGKDNNGEKDYNNGKNNQKDHNNGKNNPQE